MTDIASSTENQVSSEVVFAPGDVVRLRGIPGPLMVVDMCPDPDVEYFTVVLWFNTSSEMQQASLQTRLLERVPYQMVGM